MQTLLDAQNVLGRIRHATDAVQAKLANLEVYSTSIGEKSELQQCGSILDYILEEIDASTSQLPKIVPANQDKDNVVPKPVYPYPAGTG